VTGRADAFRDDGGAVYDPTGALVEEPQLMMNPRRLSTFAPAALLVLAATFATPSVAAERAPATIFAKKVFIRGGCPYNLDKECDRLPDGRLVHCRCVS
jgi:hypothetical protein